MDQLSQALEDRTWSEEELQVEQDHAADLAKELSAVQGQRRTTEKIWAEEVGRLHGQLLIQ